MLTSTATAATAVQKTFRGLGDQPRLLAHSIIARPRQHSAIEGYMIRLATRTDRCGVPRLRATEVSGKSTGGVATLGWGAVAHSPLKATPARPSALSSTAGSGRARRLCDSTRMSSPMRASTRPPVSGGSASRGSVAAGAGGSGSVVAGGADTVTVAASPGVVSLAAGEGSSAGGRSSALSRDGGSTNRAIDFLPVKRSPNGRTRTSYSCTQKHRCSRQIVLRDLAGTFPVAVRLIPFAAKAANHKPGPAGRPRDHV